MAGEFNAAQAQLGLVGQGGSFNPLGIPTPQPPAPPPVKSPGEVSQEITLHTTSAAANTISMAMATRPASMGMGNMSGGALGAFAQQYQSNMASIQAAQMPAYSAQALGMLGGFGGGFNTGMMPNPAQMTSPGMGIYRPPPPMATPTVSPFPQTPMLPHPFTPNIPPPRFQTPMEQGYNAATQAGISNTAMALATPGVAARGAMDVGLAFGGQALGASLGARFGAGGAAIGRMAGLAAGAFAGEGLGIGAATQHIVDRMNPFRGPAARTQQLLGASQDFVTAGADLSTSGRGLTAGGAARLGTMLTNTARDTGFQRETGNAFSTQDMIRLTQESGKLGMLEDTQSVEQIHRRVKTLAKSLSGFMKIAGEPDVMNALKTMANLKSMGLSLAETMETAGEARMYSKMAGTTVKGIMEQGGAPGAMLFQQQGLSAGLGFRVGMGSLGMAQTAVASGAYTPQRLAMLGGVSGIAQHDMQSSAAFLKQPIIAAAMSQMGAGGEFGVSGSAVQGLLRGKTDIGQMTSQAANNLLSAATKGGPGALAMYQLQESELQDQVGRLLGPQGLKIAKGNQVLQTMKMMGLRQDPGSFALAAMGGHGMTSEQTRAMMSEMASPEYHENIQRHLLNQRNEERRMEYARREAERPDLGRVMAGSPRAAGFRRGYKDIGESFDQLSEGFSSFFFESEEAKKAKESGQVYLQQRGDLVLSREARAAGRDVSISKQLEAYRNYATSNRNVGNLGFKDTAELGGRIVRNAFMGGDPDVMRQYREAMGEDRVMGGTFEQVYRLNNALGNPFAFNQLESGELMRTKIGKVNQMGEIMSSARNLSAKEEGALGKTIETKFGSEATSKAAYAMAEQAKKFHSGGILSNIFSKDKKMLQKTRSVDVDEMRAAVRASDPKLAQATDAEIDMIMKASGALAGTLAGEAADALDPRAMYDTATDREFTRELALNKKQLMRGAFGKDVSTGQLEKGSSREKVYNRLFLEEKNEKVGLLAAAMSAGTDNAEAQKVVAELWSKLSPEERARARKAADEIRKDGNVDLAKDLANNLIKESGGNVETMSKRMSTDVKAVRGATASERQKRGLEGAGLKADKYLKKAKTAAGGEEFFVSDAATILGDLSEEEIAAISSDKIRELATEFKKAKKEGRDTAAIEEEFTNQLDKLAVQGDRAEGGAKTNEKLNEKLRGAAAEQAGEMSKIFPEAVSSFQKSTIDFANAVADFKGTERPYKENVVEGGYQ